MNEEREKLRRELDQQIREQISGNNGNADRIAEDIARLSEIENERYTKQKEQLNG